VGLKSKLVLPDFSEGLAADSPKVLEWKVRVGAGGQLPSWLAQALRRA